MNKLQQDVREFMVAMGQETFNRPRIGNAALATKLIFEECNKELLPAIEHEDLVEIIDGGLDTIYVIMWMFNSYGIDIQPFWNEIQRTNMAKKDGPIDPESGKKLKPPGWRPPRIKEMLDEVMHAHKECGGRGEVQGETEMVLCYCDRGRRPDAPPRLAQGTDLSEIRQLLYFHKD